MQTTSQAARLSTLKGNSGRRNMADLMAALMWGPKSIAELMEITGLSETAVRGNLTAMRDAGLTYLSRKGCENNRRRVALQPKPFAHKDDEPWTASKRL